MWSVGLVLRFVLIVDHLESETPTLLDEFGFRAFRQDSNTKREFLYGARTLKASTIAELALGEMPTFTRLARTPSLARVLKNSVRSTIAEKSSSGMLPQASQSV